MGHLLDILPWKYKIYIYYKERCLKITKMYKKNILLLNFLFTPKHLL